MAWKPQPKQKLFLSLPWYEVLFGGAKGPGKTDALLAEAVRQVDNPNYKAIIFRRTLPKLQEIIDRSQRWFSNWATFNGDIHRWTFPSGATIKFGYCKDEKDKYNYQGHEYHFMGFDQLEEFTETQYLFLIAQNRTTDKSIICYVRSTANPGNIGHTWVKMRFIDKLSGDGKERYFKRVNDEDIETTIEDSRGMSRAFVFSTVDDNKILLENDPDYLKVLEMLPESDYKALRWGDWDIFTGQFFREWSKRIHVVSGFDRTYFRSFISIDYGYTHPASVGWYAVLPEKIIRYKEIYGEGYTYEDLARKILDANGDTEIDYAVADPAIWGDKSHHLAQPILKREQIKGESGAETMQRVFGEKFGLIKADNARIIGWGRVRQYLKPFNQLEEMVVKFQVTDNCINFIRTLPGLIHDTENPEDLDTAGEDHCADEVRYALMSRPIRPELPQKDLSKSEQFWNMVRADKEILVEKLREDTGDFRSL